VQAVSPDLPAVQVLHSSVVSPIQVNDPVFSTRQGLETDLPRMTNLWADSGDAISLIYAGTGALKADVTRYGKRSFLKGPMDDGLNSLTRYYLNNFADGRKQDALDLWSGKVSKRKVVEYASSLPGTKKQKQAQKPILDKKKSFVVKSLPESTLLTLEPLFQSIVDYQNVKLADSKDSFDLYGNPTNLPAFIIHALKLMGPKTISSFFELFVALWVAFYIVLFSAIFGVDGFRVVNRPVFSNEHVKIYSLVPSAKHRPLVLEMKEMKELKND
jgi:hypothetical protein